MCLINSSIFFIIVVYENILQNLSRTNVESQDNNTLNNLSCSHQKGLKPALQAQRHKMQK